MNRGPLGLEYTSHKATFFEEKVRKTVKLNASRASARPNGQASPARRMRERAFATRHTESAHGHRFRAAIAASGASRGWATYCFCGKHGSCARYLAWTDGTSPGASVSEQVFLTSLLEPCKDISEKPTVIKLRIVKEVIVKDLPCSYCNNLS